MKAMVGTAHDEGERPCLPQGLGEQGQPGPVPRSWLHCKHFVQGTPLGPTHIATPRPRFMIFLIHHLLKAFYCGFGNTFSILNIFFYMYLFNKDLLRHCLKSFVKPSHE